jgi:inner membrane transporter RhtA
MWAGAVDVQPIRASTRDVAIPLAEVSSDHAPVAHIAATRTRGRVPPQAYFGISALFHYLGPALAVLLFAHVPVLGVAWLRIFGAALVFAGWRRPWRIVAPLGRSERRTLVAFASVLAVMNSLFYLAVDRLPLATVGAIEFLGTIALAAIGVRNWRNTVALLLAVGGAAVLTNIAISGQPLGFVFAFGNCALFMLYVVLGHRVANTGQSGIDLLGGAMLIAAMIAAPWGFGYAIAAFTDPRWLLLGITVGICSSVIPYVIDQLVMANVPRATFALMLALLPACATIIGAIVLGQIPTLLDCCGILLVVAGVALHRPA